MKLLIAALFMLTFLASNAQKSQPKLIPIDHEKMKQQIDRSMKELDSINMRMNEGMKRSMQTMDSINNHLEKERNIRSIESFMAMQKEREAKQKKSNWLRLGFGIILLGVLIFGWLRKRKKATQ